MVGVELVLASNQRAAVFVGGLAAYSTGVEFEVRVLTAEHEWLDPSLDGVYSRRRGGPPEDTFDELLRFGVEFSDGRKATNIGSRGPREASEEDPVLTGLGGGGGNSRWREGFWLWPLPPPGQLTFVCEWPAAGIPFTRVGIDAQPVLDAAARARVVFPGDRHGDSQVSWSTTFVSAPVDPATEAETT